MKRFKKAGVFIFSILFLFAVVMAGYAAENEKNTLNLLSAENDGNKLVLNKDGMKLSYDEAEKSIKLTDDSGYIWYGTVTDDLYSSDKLNESWQQNTKSIFHISYADISNVNPTIRTEYSYNSKIEAKLNEDKIQLQCSFSKIGISLTVELSIENNELIVSLPSKSISEGKKYKLLKVDMLPYFGACTGNEEGYIIYPDGCGALKYHNSVKSATTSNHSYAWDVYGYEAESSDAFRKNEEKGIMTAMLPVFGVKKSDHAFIAYSESGEEESAINMSPSGIGIELNRISFSFKYRTSYNILMSNININGTNTAKNINGLMYGESIIELNHEVRYGFLNGANSDYSGMACKYREKLLLNGSLKKSNLQNRLGISVRILMAANAQGTFKNTVSVSTTDKQVKEITDFVNGIGFNENAIFTLKGWSKGGYGIYPQSSKPDTKVASISEIANLINGNSLLSLQTDLFYANDVNGGFNKRSDVIKFGNQNVVTDSTEDLYLFNIPKIRNNFDTLKKTYSSVNNLNVSLDVVGKFLYRDENEKCFYNRADMRKALEEILKDAKQCGTVSVEGGNLYTLKYADSVYNLPSRSSEYFISDADIPFCQMVLFGSVPYSGDLGNLSSDYDKQILKWIEYGYIPEFELTYSDSSALKKTGHNDLYSSQYESNKERLQQAYKAYDECLKKIENSYMLKHSVLENGLIRVEYSNGISIYINYSDSELTFGNITVAAGEYVVAGD